MPALVKSRVGSFAGRSELLRTTRCPRAAKKSRKRWRISLPVTRVPFIDAQSSQNEAGDLQAFTKRSQSPKPGANSPHWRIAQRAEKSGYGEPQVTAQDDGIIQDSCPDKDLPAL